VLGQDGPVSTRRAVIGLLIGTAVALLTLTVAYGVLIRTGWGQQFDNDAYFGRDDVPRHYELLNQTVLDLVTKTSIAFIVIILVGIGYLRRCVAVALIAVAAWGCAMVGAELFKRVLPRPDLVQDPSTGTPPGFLDNTFPSGHTTVTTALGLALVLLVPARWRPWTALGAGILSATYAEGVLFAGWHRPSDAIGGIAWSTACLSIAALICVRWRGTAVERVNYPWRAAACSVVLAVAVPAAAWLTALHSDNELPDTDAPFMWLTTAIAGCAFLATAWFGWQLRSVDWGPELGSASA
jgi:membrane-associated phospholipid phosphatase